MALTRKQMLARCQESERKADWFRFLRHAFDGSGGFAPIVPAQTRAGTGALASLPDWWDGNSYLLKHEGEELEEWYERVLTARYPNHPRKVVGTWLGLLLRRGPTRKQEGLDPALEAFMANADGAGHSWDGHALPDACTRGILGGCLTLVDRPNDRGARSRLEAGGPAYITQIDPDALYDYHLDERGAFEWAKIVEQVIEHPSPDSDAIYLYRCRIWYRDTWEVWLASMSGTEEPVLFDEGLNTLGRVPLVVLTYQDSVGRDLWGWSPADELGQIARDDYQGLSRHVELLEKQGFAILERPCREGEERKVSTMDVGAARAVATPMESSRGMAYVGPPDGPVASHERKREADRAEALRAMGLEQLLGSGTAPASALARQYEFQSTNAQLATYAKRVSRYEKDVLRLVLLYDGRSDDDATEILKQTSAEWPDDFDIRDRQADAILLRDYIETPGIDVVSKMAAIRQYRDTVVQLSDEEREDSDKELRKQAEAEKIEPPPEPPEFPAAPSLGATPEPGASPFDGGTPPTEAALPG